MKTLLAMMVFLVMIECAQAGLISRGGMSKEETEKRAKAMQEQLDKQNKERMIYEHKKYSEQQEKESEERIKEATALYDSQAERNLKTTVFDPQISVKENIEKHGIKVVEADSLSEAGILAKKYASKDSKYILKQIESSNELSLYKISTVSPYFINDSKYKKIETLTLDYPDIKYKKTFVKQYPDQGISTKRNYKFITLSKTANNKEIKFEENEVIFVKKGLDLNVKVNQLHCVTITGNIPSELVKKVISQHNKELAEEEKKTKEKYNTKNKSSKNTK